MIILLSQKPYRVVSKQHVTPGKGNAVVQTVLQNLETGGNINHRFRSAETVETARLESHDLQFMYKSGDDYSFMNQESYEMIDLPGDTLGENAKYLKEEMVITAQYWQGKVVGIEVPMTVMLKITETEPAIKGATASGGPKPATLENGLVVKVPRHLNTGDMIKIDTRDDSFIERVTE
jgi:elongation factor P